MINLLNNFNLSQFDEYREDNRREVKKANGGLPLSQINEETKDLQNKK